MAVFIFSQKFICVGNIPVKKFRMMSETESLRSELAALQSENMKLYEELSVLKKAKRNSEKAAVSDFSETDRVNSLIEQQGQEEANRLTAKKSLNQAIQNLQSIQKEITEISKSIQSQSIPEMKQEEANTEKYYNEILEQYQKLPGADVERMKSLITKLLQKSKEAYHGKEEVEKLERLISINNPVQQVQVEPTENSLQSFENPLPCFSNARQSLDMARMKRRVSFKIGST